MKEAEPIKETLPYQASCQMCHWSINTEDLETAMIAGNNHYNHALGEGEIHQIWYGLRSENPEWIK